ncbi:gliding motility-associated C-terminal domain-containing protein [Pontibacter vulgaris]|uniref:T9SS type B sorting domain-containing protein n=1 Tax=Pontibacter vulgaris TaxID=2905679 RepID=UPI001FA80111|nr:gliding motility-associated C-terminal domain-containing protein [Pontibacter vulgaris]
MKYLLFILLFTLVWLSGPVKADSGNCFKAIQQSMAVDVICVNQPVSFQDCSSAPGQKPIIFYYVGPEKFDPRNYDPAKYLTGSAPYTFSQPGKYIITQIINRGKVDQNGQVVTEFYERELEVKTNPRPIFSVGRCANRQIRVTITDKTYDNYTLKFGSAAAQAVQSGQQLTYTFNTTEPPEIILTGTYTNSACSNSMPVEIKAFLPELPKLVFTELILNNEDTTNGSISINTGKLEPGFIYVLEQAQNGSSTFSTVDTLRNVTDVTTSYTINKLNTAQPACFRIRVTDACSSSGSTSNILCTVNLKATAADKEIKLDWPLNPIPVTGYELYDQSKLIAALPASANTYTAKNLTCGQNYCYKLKAIKPGGYTSTSAQVCLTATSTTTPAAPYLLSTFDLDNQVVLAMQAPQDQNVKQVELQRSINGASYQVLPGVQQFPYTDKVTELPKSVCYKATYSNACGLTSIVSNTTCPVILSARQTTEGEVILNWTSFTGFKDGTGAYTLELLTEASTILTSYPVTGNNYTDRSLNYSEQMLRYRIKVVSKSGAATTFSNIQTIKQEVQLHIPSGFTPNNDGLNDVFEVKGKFYREFSIRIYNSMGQVVYTSSDATAGWDGMYNGRKMPAGAYTYEVNVKAEDGTFKRRTGTVTLIR